MALCMACDPRNRNSGVPTLVDISLDWLAANINLVSGLDFVPEDLVVSLFQVGSFYRELWFWQSS